jgi:hypothetical protein
VFECENILGQLEQQIASPRASPQTIIKQVSMIPSATMPSNRIIAPWLRQRLDEVAKHHGGSVPLHGRLFAQWLHYAYPRECQFPHVSGTTNPQRPEDIVTATNGTEEDLSASEAVMKQTIAQAPPRKNRVPGVQTDANEESGMWCLNEELVVWHANEQRAAWSLYASTSGKQLAMIGAIVSLSFALVRNLKTALSNGLEVSSEKYLV